MAVVQHFEMKFAPPHRIPLSAPDIQADDVELVARVLRSSRLSIGPFIKELERGFADYIGTKYAVAVTNGTSGLHLCMRAAGMAEGDEVITTPFSFLASANCILYERATPVFVDIDEASLNIDPALAARAVTARTRAMLPVHVFGQPCAMDELQAVCRDRSLVLVEDACEAVGAEYKGRKVGTFGKAAVFSFYPNKAMTLGEGAVVTTDDPHWAELMQSLRNQGRGDGGTGYSSDRLGYNYRLDEMSAALGVAQLARLDRLLAQRQAVAARYGDMLRRVPGVTVKRTRASTTRMSWFVFVIHLDPHIDRDRVIEQLEVCGIPSRVYFTPIHLEPYYRQRFGFKPGDFPVAERVAASILALPFHTNLSDAEMDEVVDALQSAVVRAAA
jgi:perosamine synthetase